jgi:hypothetical protein
MNTFQRMKLGVQVGLRAVRNADSIEKVSRNIDKLVEAGAMEEKEAVADKSQLDIRNTKSDLAYASAYYLLRNFSLKKDEIPNYGTQQRDTYISKIWREEPILAGAIYSMSAKLTALSWRITGKKNLARKYAKMFSNAEHIGGYDWGGFIASVAQDFYTTDRGVFIETPRATGLGSPMVEIGHIDSLCCWLTGNTERPVEYVSDLTGQTIRFKPHEIMHFSSLPSTREIDVGMGFCAVSRALKAAKLLIGLHEYDVEKLNNLPPEGVAAVTGMTMDEFQDAITLWMAKRKQDDSLTFPQVLWLIGSMPGSEVKVNFQGFSQLPESFDREKVVTQYVNTLALCFGVDAREFWPISSGSLGTASESEIQHLKAKGKGAGEFISISERMINGELPEGVDFEFDTQDIEEDMVAANTAQAWISAFLPLYTSKPGSAGPVAGPGAKPGGQATNNPTGPNGPKMTSGEGSVLTQMKEFPNQMPGENPANASEPPADPIITKDQLLRLLADKGVLPDYMARDDRTVLMDSDIHKEHYQTEEVSRFTWKAGVLTEQRLPPIILYSPAEVDSSGVEIIANKENSDEEIPPEKVPVVKRNIVGNPIPDEEVVRGARITKTTVSDENELWRENPELAEHALTPEEVKKYKV